MDRRKEGRGKRLGELGGWGGGLNCYTLVGLELKVVYSSTVVIFTFGWFVR